MTGTPPPIISRTAQYALQALVFLAGMEGEGPVYGRVIAEGAEVPANYLSKILHVLRREGLVETQRGRGGGYLLTAPAGEIRIRRVLAAFDDMEAFDGCLLGHHEACGDVPCRGHRRWLKVAEQVRGFFDSTTLVDFLPDHGAGETERLPPAP